MVVQHSHMTPSGTESENLQDLLLVDIDKVVIYENNIDFIGHNMSPIIILTSEDDSSRAPNLFPKRGAADALIALRPSISST